jgi:hypothetical protein
MHGALWVLGLVMAAIGLFAIGFGIAPSTLSFGNTLIMAGTTATVGGSILVGLAAVIRQLKRIADAGINPTDVAHAIPSAMHDPRATYLASSQNQSLASQPPAPAPMLRPEAKPAPIAPEANSVDWLRPRDKEPTLGERAVIEEFEASLAPQPGPPPPLAAPPSPPPRPASVSNLPRMPEARSWPPSPAPVVASSPGPVSEQQPVQPRQDAAARPLPERASGGLFDSVWPELRSTRSAETVERVRRSEPGTPQSREELKAEPKAARPSGELQAAPESRPVAILKSGMIDGMAYTLFADGSIEAVLPSGTLRFASVDALRLHLEKSA